MWVEDVRFPFLFSACLVLANDFKAVLRLYNVCWTAIINLKT